MALRGVFWTSLAVLGHFRDTPASDPSTPALSLLPPSLSSLRSALSLHSNPPTSTISSPNTQVLNDLSKFTTNIYPARSDSDPADQSSFTFMDSDPTGEAVDARQSLLALTGELPLPNDLLKGYHRYLSRASSLLLQTHRWQKRSKPPKNDDVLTLVKNRDTDTNSPNEPNGAKDESKILTKIAKIYQSIEEDVVSGITPITLINLTILVAQITLSRTHIYILSKLLKHFCAPFNKRDISICVICVYVCI